MIFNQNRVEFLLTLFFLLACGAFVIDAPGWGYSPVEYLLVIVFFLGFVLSGWTWIDMEQSNHILWRNTAESSRYSVELQTARELNKMTDARFEGYLYIRALDAADPEAREAFVERYGELASRLREATNYAAMVQDEGGYRRYALDALSVARERDGFLPAQHGPQNARRDVLKAYYERLVKEKAAEPAVGPKPPRVTNWERAAEIAREMGA